MEFKKSLNFGKSVLKLEIIWKSDYVQLQMKVRLGTFHFFVSPKHLPSLIFYSTGGKTLQPTFIL
jgi:hypothetical protein